MFKTFQDLIKYIFANHVGFSKLQAQLVNFIFKSTFTLFLISNRTPANRFVVSLPSCFIVVISFGLIFRSPYLTQASSFASSFFSKARYLQNYFSQQRKLTSYLLFSFVLLWSLFKRRCRSHTWVPKWNQLFRNSKSFLRPCSPCWRGQMSGSALRGGLGQSGISSWTPCTFSRHSSTSWSITWGFVWRRRGRYDSYFFRRFPDVLSATSSAWFVSLSQIVNVCVRDDQDHAPRAARRARWSWPGSPCSPAQKSSAGRAASPPLELSSASPRSAAAKYIVQKSKGETKSAKSSFNVLYEPVKYVDIYKERDWEFCNAKHFDSPLIIVDIVNMENVSNKS